MTEQHQFCLDNIEELHFSIMLLWRPFKTN